MVSDVEIEKAKDTMANGISALWVTHGGKPSRQLNMALEENPDISVEIWLDVLTRIKDPRLVAYVIQYLNLEPRDHETVGTNQKRSVGLLSKEMLSSYVVTGIALYFIVGFIKDLFGH